MSNKNRQRLCHELESLSFVVLNSRSPSDPYGEYTFDNTNGASTVDLVWTNHLGSLFSDYEVLTSNLSDHSPVSVSCYTSANEPSTSQPRQVLERTRLDWKSDLKNPHAIYSNLKQ